MLPNLPLSWLRPNNKMKKIISLLLSVITALSLFSGTVFSASEDGTTHISARIIKNGQYIEIEGTFSSTDVEKYKDKSLSLFALEPGSYIGEQPAELKNVTVKSRVSLQVSFTDGKKIAYVLAYENEDGEFTAATNYAYISNFDVIAKNTYEYPDVKSKKGLDIALFADAQMLGVSHAVIKVPINEYIVSDGSNASKYKSGCMTYYYDKSKTAALCRTVKAYSEAGIRVYIQLLLTKCEDNQPEYLYFDNADKNAEYFAINVYSKQACDALYAFVSFLSDKFSSEDREGFCGSYILGCEVNSNRYTNNAGPMSLSEYTEVYEKALRIVDSAARSVYSNARVYVSVSNNFNKPSSDNNSDSMLDYSVMDFLSHLADSIKSGGDIPWRLSVDPYNINRDKADFKGAEGSEYSYDAKYITMDNINILTSLLSQPAYLYDGQRRPLLIGEISYPAGGNSADDQKAQAAAYCLAYYKAEANEQIEAIIYADHVDSASDKRNPGLYTRAAGTENTADAQKSIYSVFRLIDTEYSAVTTEPYLSYFNVTTWGEAVSGYSLSQPQRRCLVTGSGATEITDPAHLAYVRVTDFSGENLGFDTSENSDMIQKIKDETASSLYGSEYSLEAKLNNAPAPEYRGVSANRDFDISGTEYAVLDMKVSSGEENGLADVVFRMTGKNENGADVVYEGISSVSLGQYYRLYFDVTEFCRSCPDTVGRVSVWVKPHKEEDGKEYDLLINGISFAKPDSDAKAGSIAKTVIIILIVTVVLAAAAYAIMYLRSVILYHNKKKKIEEKRRKNRVK